MFDTVWGRHFAHFAVQMHYNVDDDSALIFVCLMCGTVIGLALNQQRVRFYYCCVCALIWRCYWHSMQYGVVIAPSLCVVQIHYNGDGDSALIFVRRTGGVLALNQQAVRLYCCLRVRLNLNVSVVFNAVWGRNFTLIMWCPNTLQWRWRLCVDLCWLNVWNVCRVGGWL